MRKAKDTGLRSKRHHFKSGRKQRGTAFSHGQIYALLRNPVDIDKIKYKTHLWDAQHEAIIDVEQFEQVQTMMHGRQCTTEIKGAN